MIPIGRVSSATMDNLGAYESKDRRLARIFEGRRKSFLPKTMKVNKRSLPTSLERRMPGRDQYDGFDMRMRKGRGKRRTIRRKKRTRKNKRKKKRNTRR